MRDIAEIDRPREKLIVKGAASLRDEELIAAIIGSGARGKDVMVVAREIAALLVPGKQPAPQDLMSINGIGEAKASQILACFELSRRYLTKSLLRITSPEQVPPFVCDILDKKQEHFLCLMLNGANEVIGRKDVTVGLLNHTLVHPREVFAEAIEKRAASVILVHNHPSGSLDPSQQDIAITRQLAESGTVLGIQVHDHVIVTRQHYTSMRERGLM
ncbi:MAG: DNA repair protein RadC [Methanomicrobiales archaeon]|nr:DNA repair protein RadC [Methanomicrobiales archaeon]